MVIQGAQQQVPRHHRGHIRSDGPLEGGKLDGLQPFTAVGQHGQFEVRIACGVAVAGEVLGAAEHAFGLGGLDEGSSEGADGVGVLTPGAHVDDRIGRIVVDVANGSQDPVQPELAGFAGGAAAIGGRQGQGGLRVMGVDPAHAHGRRQPAGSLEALAHPLFHIGAEQQGLGTPTGQLVGAEPDLGGAAAQQDHPADPFGQ